MSRETTSLMDCHGALSALSHAVSLELADLAHDVIVQWRNGTYLSVQVEVREKHKQKVIDRLSRGAIQGPYDYRFTLSYPTGISDPEEWVWVAAYPDMHRDHARVHPKPEKAAA